MPLHADEEKSSGVCVEACGPGPRGVRAWLSAGHIWIATRRGTTSTALRGRTAVSPLRWTGDYVTVCTLGARGSGRFHRVARDGTDHPLELPRNVIDALPLPNGFSLALADPRSGHVCALAFADEYVQIVRLDPIRPAWRVAGEACGDTARWVLSRRGHRVAVAVSAAGVIHEPGPPWPTPGWRQHRFCYPNRPVIPAWMRPARAGEPTWVLLHGGPFSAWDHGPPTWLTQVADHGTGIVLLESPGAVGFGARLTRWYFDSSAVVDFERVLALVWRRLRTSTPTSRLYLVGESDGAGLAAAHLTSAEAAPWDGVVLINGEYLPRPASRPPIAPVLFVVSRDDDVVDSQAAYRLAALLATQGTSTSVCEVVDGHRWRHPTTSRAVASAVLRTVVRQLQPP